MWKRKREPASEAPSEASSSGKEPRKKGKLLLILMVVPILLGGAFGVLAAMGKIPGVSLAGLIPKGKQDKSAPLVRTGEDQAAKKAAQAPKPKGQAPRRPAPQTLVVRPLEPLPDLDKGAKAMARIWERLDPEKVAEMAGSYRDPQLARILNSMDSKKSAAVLGVLDAKRAALLCQEMEKQSAMPEPSQDESQSSI